MTRTQDAATREGVSWRVLTERDIAMLEFERTSYAHVGEKEQAIRQKFGMSSARYYQLLGTLIDSPAALVYDPMLIKRLRRARANRAAARASRIITPR